MTAPRSLDLSFLRSFVLGVELGNFARASEKIARSAAAVSTQMKRLEETVGVPLFRREGRLLALTPAGHALYSKAKELLQLHDDTLAVVRGTELRGPISLGLQEDFGELLVPQLLSRFAADYPQVELNVRVARNRELEALVRTAKLDLALTWGDVPEGLYGQRIARLKMRWIGSAHNPAAQALAEGGQVRLALFDAPCAFRDAAIAALDRRGMRWQCSYTSSSLGGLYSAARAGLGLTVRTALALPPGLEPLPSRRGGLPPLPGIALSAISGRAELPPQVLRLVMELRTALAQ